MLPQAILGLNDAARDDWTLIQGGDVQELTMKRKSTPLQCMINVGTIRLLLVHQSTLEDAIEAYFETGLLLDGVSLVETKQGLRVRVDARGVASLFEYDPLIRRVSLV